MNFNKQKVAENFSNASGEYDKWADAQKLIALRFDKILPELSIDKKILEFGCGTGLLTELLVNNYPNNTFTAIDIAAGMTDYCSEKFNADYREFKTSDIESYTFNEKLDLIISSSTLQWCSDISRLFSSFRNSLNEKSIFTSAVLVSGTFSEFYNSYEAVTGNSNVDLFFRDSDYYLSKLKSNNFKITSSNIYCDVLKYSDAAEAMRSVKRIGAVLDRISDEMELTDKLLAEIIRYYNKTYKDTDGNVILSYNSLYFTGEV
ncbi:MAG: methyltransferase domain-containing protein [Planctomycetota bacterium]|jgi:malonyl-CoA O-methyltransferase